MPWKKELEELTHGKAPDEIIDLTVHWQDGTKSRRLSFVRELKSVVKACIQEHGPGNRHNSVEQLSHIKIADQVIFQL